MKTYRKLTWLLISLFLACGGGENRPAAGGPTDTIRQYIEASQKGDVATMKSLLSGGSLELIEKAAEDQRTSVEEILRRETMVKVEKMPEMRNERIEGDTATVELKNERTGQFDMKMPLVKEDGGWKIARDKYIEQLIEKLKEDMNRPSTDPAPAGEQPGPEANRANSAANK